MRASIGEPSTKTSEVGGLRKSSRQAFVEQGPQRLVGDGKLAGADGAAAEVRLDLVATGRQREVTHGWRLAAAGFASGDRALADHLAVFVEDADSAADRAGAN